MLDDALTSLIDGAYAMALDPTLEETWLRRASTTLGGVVGTLAVAAPASGLFRMSSFHRLNQQLVDNYFSDGMLRFDPQLKQIRRLDRATLYLDTDHVDKNDPDTTEFLSYSRGKIGIDHHMTLFAPLATAGCSVGLSISRHKADGHTPTIERERLAAMAPLLLKAFTLGVEHADKLRAAFWNGICATSNEPAILIGETGTVIAVTPGAGALLARGNALDIVGGRLFSCDATANDRLAPAISKAIRSPDSLAGAVRLPRRLGGAPIVATIFPLTRSHRMLAPLEAAALVTIIDPARRQGPVDDLAASAFGLTTREAEVASQLLAGHSVESASAVAGVSIATTRLLLRRVFAKTETTRQTDLIRLLSRL